MGLSKYWVSCQTLFKENENSIMGISSRMGRNQQNVLGLPKKYGLGTRNGEGMWGLQLQNSHHLSLD